MDDLERHVARQFDAIVEDADGPRLATGSTRRPSGCRPRIRNPKVRSLDVGIVLGACPRNQMIGVHAASAGASMTKDHAGGELPAGALPSWPPVGREVP